MPITADDIRRLQRQVRWLFVVVAISLAATAGVFLIRAVPAPGEQDAPHEVIRSQRFVIVTPDGDEVGELTQLGGAISESGPGLFLRDSRGNIRLALFIDAWDAAWLQLRDSQDNRAISAWVSAEDQQTLRARTAIIRDDLRLRGMPLKTDRD